MFYEVPSLITTNLIIGIYEENYFQTIMYLGVIFYCVSLSSIRIKVLRVYMRTKLGLGLLSELLQLIVSV
jgi:hypothetical protein